jgi:hypothetical protein
MSRTVRIAVAKGGAITVEAKGFKGEGCQPLVEELSAKIRGEVKESEHTEEFYEREETREQRQ